MKQVIGTILAAFGRVMIGILVILVLIGVLQQTRFGLRIGFGYAVVVSGSMEPNIHVNDVLVFQKHKQEAYHPGDVVLYIRGEGTTDEMLISHRIVSIDGDTVITKGDANMTEDPPISFSQIVGRVALRIPFIGRAVRLMRTRIGLAVAVLLVAALIFLSIFLPKVRKQKPVKTVMGEQKIKY